MINEFKTYENLMVNFKEGENRIIALYTSEVLSHNCKYSPSNTEFLNYMRYVSNALPIIRLGNDLTDLKFTEEEIKGFANYNFEMIMSVNKLETTKLCYDSESMLRFVKMFDEYIGKGGIFNRTGKTVEYRAGFEKKLVLSLKELKPIQKSRLEIELLKTIYSTESLYIQCKLVGTLTEEKNWQDFKINVLELFIMINSRLASENDGKVQELLQSLQLDVAALILPAYELVLWEYNNSLTGKLEKLCCYSTADLRIILKGILITVGGSCIILVIGYLISLIKF